MNASKSPPKMKLICFWMASIFSTSIVYATPVLPEKSIGGVFPSTEATRSLRLDVSDVAYLWPFQGSDGSYKSYLSVLDEKDPSRDLIPKREILNDLIKFSSGRSFSEATDFKLERVEKATK